MKMKIPNSLEGEIKGLQAWITETKELVCEIKDYEKAIYRISRIMSKQENGNICPYCNCEIPKGKGTMDHRFPLNFCGGVPLTDCLIMVCSKCNHEKDCLTEEQYDDYKSFKESGASKQELKELKKQYREENKKKFMETKRFLSLPEDWVDYDFNLKDIDVCGRMSRQQILKTNKFQECKRFFKECGYFQHPIIVDAKGRLASGKEIYEFAKVENILLVPVIEVSNLIIKW